MGGLHSGVCGALRPFIGALSRHSCRYQFVPPCADMHEIDMACTSITFVLCLTGETDLVYLVCRLIFALKLACFFLRSPFEFAVIFMISLTLVMPGERSRFGNLDQGNLACIIWTPHLVTQYSL